MATEPKTYTMNPFTKATLDATKKAWDLQLKKHQEDLLSWEWQRVLEDAASKIDYSKGDQFAYGIFEDGCDTAEAIVLLVYRKEAKKWLKLLELNLSPSVDLSFSDQTLDIQQLSSIFGAAVIGTIRLTGTAHPTKVTKLYGRSGTLLSFLKGVGAYIEREAQIKGLRVSIQGRWLVFQYE